MKTVQLYTAIDHFTHTRPQWLRTVIDYFERHKYQVVVSNISKLVKRYPPQPLRRGENQIRSVILRQHITATYFPGTSPEYFHKYMKDMPLTVLAERKYTLWVIDTHDTEFTVMKNWVEEYKK